MIFDNKETYCILEVLKLLSEGKTKYSQMFKITKVSHTTLQRVLTGLLSKKFIKKHDIGHMKVDYEITDKGKGLLDCLSKLEEILK